MPNPESRLEINHIDGNKQNNRVENLEWVSHSENIKHAYKTGLKKQKSGEGHCRAKLTNEQVKEIRKTYVKGSVVYGQRALAKIYGVSQRTIADVIYNKKYKNI